MRYNHITIAGRLVRDGELKYTTAGVALLKLRIAYDQGGKDNKTTGFVDVCIFKERGERIAGWCKKGRQVLVGGRLNYREWEADGGGKRSAVEIDALDLEFLDPPVKDEGAPADAGGAPFPPPNPGTGLQSGGAGW